MDLLTRAILGTAGSPPEEPTPQWDLTYASFDGLPHYDLPLRDRTTSLCGPFFGPDGTDFYHGEISGQYILQYEVGSPYDLRNATFVRKLDVSANASSAAGVFFKPDGLKMFVCDYSGDRALEYTLTTAWDISTASYSQQFSFASQAGDKNSFTFKPDGTKLYALTFSYSDDAVYEYDLSTAWDLSSAVTYEGTF